MTVSGNTGSTTGAKERKWKVTKKERPVSEFAGRFFISLSSSSKKGRWI
jgi:hypothetical protein